mmetsp:Transcript_519/g.1591  ORF Transcript_519/g.1591 Transcript_519/m.1591 type:complete len:213 (+) Transcript_519:335-973(+)
MRGQIEKGEERENKLTLSISPSTKPHRFTQQMSTSRYLCSVPVLLTLMFTSWWILSLSFCAMRSVRDRAHGEMTALATTASTTEAKVSDFMIPRSSDVFATTNANSPHALIAHPMVKKTVGLGKSTWGGDGPKTPVTTFPRSATRRRAANPTTSKVHKSLTGTLKATLQEKKILSIHVSILFTWECHKAWILPTVQKHRPARKAPRRKEDLP